MIDHQDARSQRTDAVYDLSDAPPVRPAGVGHRVGPADDAVEARIERIERFAHLMDRSIELPLVRWRIGLDGLIGLIPGIGDTVTTAASGWLLAEGWRLGARKRVMLRMLGNLGIDWVIGLVPLVGDLLDFGYKANAKNARLLAAELRERRGTVRERG